ncbi:hypothetical protein TH30_00955 [Thalassospira profundimaris]|uniref:Uncharacterized protein n=1 Tax=Thalassospira profundimaris TaxID=502049 RepID=A0A367X5J6_9PROT|nr:hypothetical protein TH30_00955 [Thalassospira profundimaris]
MIRTNTAYLLQQVTEAGSRAFSGDRALARRKALDAAEVAIASRKGGRKEHEAKRSVPSPATLPVGETRGFGGKAPDLGSHARTSNNSWCCAGWLAIVASVRKSKWDGELHPVCAGSVGPAFNRAVCFKKRYDLNSATSLSAGVVACCNSDVKRDRHDYVITVGVAVVLADQDASGRKIFAVWEWRVCASPSVATFGRKLTQGVNDLCEGVFHKIFQRKHLGAFTVGLHLSQWILAQSVSVANNRAQRNVRGAVFVSRPPLVTGGKI